MVTWLIYLAVGAVGAASVITQLALMREMLGAFAGHELALGIMLGNWLLLNGLGAWLGRKSDKLRHRETVLLAGLLLVALLPLAQLVLLRLLRNVVFLPGTTPGFGEIFAGSFVLLLPFCLVTGFLLTLACGLTGDIGGVYVVDGIGSVVGGVVFSFVLIRYLDHFGILCVPALLTLAVVGCYRPSGAPLRCSRSDGPAVRPYHRSGHLGWQLVAVLLGLSVGVAWWWDVDAWSTARQFPGERVLFRENSPYGRLVVTEVAGQFNFIENGLPIIATHTVEQVEETVHYAMAQRPTARHVLLIGGGVAGTVREVLKYPLAAVTYVELDPLIIVAGQRFLPGNLNDPRIHVVTADGRLFIKSVFENSFGSKKWNGRLARSFGNSSEANGRDARSTITQTDSKDVDETFDVVIVDLPAPVTAQLNRFFTTEFFADVKRALRADGVVVFAVGRYENYISPQLARMLASAYRTVHESFPNVLVIPGGRVFFVASVGDLTLDIATRLEQAKIPTQFVQRHYLAAMLTTDRLADVQRALAAPAAVNRDFSPVLYFYHLQNWLTQYPVRSRWLLGMLVAVLGIYLWRLRPVTFAIFAGGFAASALEIVLLLGVQIACGAVYQQLGLIVTAFMAGLAAGAWVVSGRARWPTAPRRATTERRAETARPTNLNENCRLAGLAFGVAAVAAVIPVMLRYAGNLPVIVAVTFGLAAVVGMEFPVASRAETTGGAATAGRLYAADLVGACLGAWLASTLLIPLLGVTLVCGLVAVLNAGAGVVVWRRKV